MAQAKANGRLVLEGEVHEPREGTWTARVELDADEGDLDGPITLEVGTVTWQGTAYGEVEGGRTLVRVVGGQGRLRTVLPARYYLATTTLQVVRDIAREAGEVLDEARSSAALLATSLARWSRTEGEARDQLTAVLRDVGGFWRLTREGKLVVLAAETWEPLTAAHVVTRRDVSLGVLEVAPDEAPLLEPGMAVGDDRVREVRTEIASGSVQQAVTLEQGRVTGTAAQLGEATDRRVDARLTYARWYPAKVVRQHPSGTVDVMPDDARVRGNGLSEVPLRHGIPGLTVRVVVGERVLLFFEDADPKKPACALWPDGSSVAEVVLEAQSRIVLASDTRLGASDAQQRQVLGDALVDWLKAHTHPTAMGPSSAPLEQATLPDVLSARHRLDQ